MPVQKWLLFLVEQIQVMKPKEAIINIFKFNIDFFKVEEVPHTWMMSTAGLVWKTLKS